MTIKAFAEADRDAVKVLRQACGLAVSYTTTPMPTSISPPVGDPLRLPCGRRDRRDGHDGHRGWLYYVAVDPAQRGQAFGRTMVQAGKDWLRERRIRKAQLLVRETNAAPRAFYERIGWSEIPRTVMEHGLQPPEREACAGRGCRRPEHGESDAGSALILRENSSMSACEESGPVDLRDAAREAGLRYVDDSKPGWTRKRSGTGFSFQDAGGETIRDRAIVQRIKKLAIPPAYTDVWICPHPNGHIQATGRDAKGRKQYRYHPDFREAREATKFERIMDFADALPGIRSRIDADMGKRGLKREKVLATVVHLLESTLIRVGNDDYARSNKSYGLSTLRDRHVTVEGSELTFRFKGKSGQEWNLSIRDRRVARIVKACQDLPGQELFQYLDDDGRRCDVTSSDVNAYLREIAGQDFTAKDFRTWAGTVLAALALREFESFDSEAIAKRNVRDAIESVAGRLGNTPTICRKCYIHPQVLDCYLEGTLLLQVKEAVESELTDGLDQLKPEEAAVLSLLRSRLENQASDQRKRSKIAFRGGSAAKKAAKRRKAA